MKRKQQKGEVITATVVVLLVALFAVLVTNGGQNMKKAEVEPVAVAEAK